MLFMSLSLWYFDLMLLTAESETGRKGKLNDDTDVIEESNTGITSIITILVLL